MKASYARYVVRLALGALFSIAGGPLQARALTLHESDYPVDDGCISRPNDSVVGMIVGNGDDRPTAHVIAPNYILTVGHWGNLYRESPPREVKISIGGSIQTFYIADGRINGSGMDLGVYRIETTGGDDANLSEWLDIYLSDDVANKTIVMGGYGPMQGGAAGTLHWGRNRIYPSSAIVWSRNLDVLFDPVDGESYVQYEAAGANGDSGTGWFLREGPEFQLVGMTVGVIEATGGSNSDRLGFWSSAYQSRYQLDWIHDNIDAMNQARPVNEREDDPRPAPDVTDTAWEGDTSTAWGTTANWTDGIPGTDDSVRVDVDGNTTGRNTLTISTETGVAKDISVGYRAYDHDADEQTDPILVGSLAQTGGTLTVGEGMYIGVTEEMTGTYTLSGGTVSAHELTVGIHGTGELVISDNSASLTMQVVHFGEGASFDATPGSEFTLAVADDCRFQPRLGDGEFVVEDGADGTDLDGLANLTLRCEFANSTGYDDAIVAAIEVAGVDTAPSMPTGTDFSNANFVLGNLTLGRDAASIPADAGRVMIRLEDWHDNQVDEQEALYVKQLSILAGATFQLDAFGDLSFNLYYDNTSPKKLIMGDADLDGDVDSDDLSDVLNTQSSGAEWSDGDFDGDRDVDADDFAFVVKNYGYDGICSNPPQDTDSDGDVDLTDYGVFLGCYNGPGKPYGSANENCPCLDSDRDGDVDLTDYGAFLDCYNGPNRAPACSPPPGPPGEGLGGMGEGLDEGGACDGYDVSFDLQSNVEGQTISAGTIVWWRAAVCVSGSNQGLAWYTGRVELRSGSPTGPLVTSVTPNTALQKPIFDVGGNGAPNGAFASDLYPNGGPYMGMVVGGAADEGFLEGFGAAYYPNWTYTSQSTRMSHGVGRDDHKSALLLDEEGDYVIQRGSIDTTGLDAGTYYVVFVPPATVGVLRDDVDLEDDVDTNVVTLTDSIAAADSISFTISSE
jgi:hypothetical protein